MANERDNIQEKDKRYYWLKLNDGFFKDRRIQLILGMRNGEKYLIFYLKLLCESIRTEGLLRFNERFAYTDEMLSALTNTDIDTVLSAKEVLTQLELIEVWDDLTIHMNGTERMIGSESDSAERVRRHREKKEQAKIKAAEERARLQAKNDQNADLQPSVTSVLQCNVENRGKDDIRVVDKSMTEQEKCITCIGAHADITKNNITGNNRLDSFFLDIFRLDVLRNRVECSAVSNPDYLKFFDEFIAILKKPWSEKNKKDLLLADMTTIYETFNNVLKVKNQAIYMGREPINDLPRYVWEALSSVIANQKDHLMDEDEYRRLCGKFGQRANELLAHLRRIKELYADKAINAKYAAYTLGNLMVQGKDIRTYDDSIVLKLIDPFYDGPIDLNADN